MADRNPEVYGTVAGIDQDGSLLVNLDGGERGYAEFEEISRQNNVRRDNLGRMIGWHMGFVPGEAREDGRIRLSAREFEEREFSRIREAFQGKTRNIYTGRLSSVTQDGKLAFYRLAQGVAGALHVSAFSLCRVDSFRNIDLPRELTVAVSGIDARGWVSLTAKPAFGDFEYSVNRLELAEGQTIEGRVVNIMSDGAAAVMLAPNLTVLVDPCCRIYPGDTAMIRIRRIDWEQHRIKAQMIERTERRNDRFDYAAWNRPAEELAAFVDVGEFDDRIRLNRVKAEKKVEPAQEPEELDFAVLAQRSPFSTYRNERVVREQSRPARVQDIYFESRMGYLNDKHMRVAAAVEELKYSSAWQIRRYLFLKDGLALTDRELKGVIDRLVKHDIIGVLRFQSDEGNLLTRVLHPSLNYRSFCGRNPRNFGPKDFIESDVSSIKTRLAANQLLIGLMRSWNLKSEINTHPFLKSDETEVRVRPRHSVHAEKGVRFLEAVRKGWEEEFCEKLKRYEILISQEKDAGECGVVAVVEDQEMLEGMLQRVSEMRLSFPVWLTDDLGCLPETKLHEIPATHGLVDVPNAARMLLQKLKQKIEDLN
ncbi:MAG: hypothetical protein IJE08_06350 [Clostridia bacterium]|nr:hypothetical protein [Clostridia bacterium]